jgi:hypothetical protein
MKKKKIFLLRLDFLVTTPPKLTWQQYVDYLDGKAILQQYHDYLQGKKFMRDSTLAKHLGVPVSVFATTVPETFSGPNEITLLSLSHCELTSLPENLGNFFFFLPSFSFFPSSLYAIDHFGPVKQSSRGFFNCFPSHHQQITDHVEVNPHLFFFFFFFFFFSGPSLSFFFFILVEFLDHRLSAVPLGPTGALTVIQALVCNFSQGNHALQFLE